MTPNKKQAEVLEAVAAGVNVARIGGWGSVKTTAIAMALEFRRLYAAPLLVVDDAECIDPDSPEVSALAKSDHQILIAGKPARENWWTDVIKHERGRIVEMGIEDNPHLSSEFVERAKAANLG